MSPKGYKFADFFLNLETHRLSKNDKAIEIGERQYQLLLMLIKASPNSVSKQNLAETIWNNTVVSDWSLFKLVSDTRQLLGDDGEQQQIIRTSRGIGFCILDVQPVLQKEQSWHTLSRGPMGNVLVKIKPMLLLSLVFIALIYGWVSYQRLQIHNSLTRIAQYQQNTFTTFVAQTARRDELTKMIELRLGVIRDSQFEKYFALNFTKLNEQEMFVFNQIRAMTEKGLRENNQHIVNELVTHPQILELIPKAAQLKQHLTFWLNKYQSLFSKRQDMCLLYVGVEDGIPYPRGVDQEILNWLENN